MRKVTEKAALALKEQRKMRSGNTEVVYQMNDPKRGKFYSMYLHGNLIATYAPGEKRLSLFDAGWKSNTTKERLNGVLQAFGISGGITQKNYVWYFVDGVWHNEPTEDNQFNGHYEETMRERWNGHKDFKVTV